VQTIHLSDETVDSYLRDFGDRLSKMERDFPRIWCAIRDAGSSVMHRLLTVCSSLQARVLAVDLDFDRNNDRIVFLHEQGEQPSFIKDQRVLILDGSVLSGKTLTSAINRLTAAGAADVSSYAVVVRRGAAVIPNHFSLLLGDHDKALFLRHECPTQRLSAYGAYRQLTEEDLDRKPVRSGADFIDKLDWHDFWCELQVDKGRRTYVYEQGGEIRAVVSFIIQAPEFVFIDRLAVDSDFRGRGLGGHLVRWVENYGQHADCDELRLWASEPQVTWYEGRGFRRAGLKLPFKGLHLVLMRKGLGYRLDSRDGSFGL
jgi:GNAT superfamily N-acetyltransferase